MTERTPTLPASRPPRTAGSARGPSATRARTVAPSVDAAGHLGHVDEDLPGQLGPFGAVELEQHGVPGQFGLQLVGGALGDDPAAIDDRDLGRVLVGLLQVVGGDEDRGAAGRQLGQHRPQIRATLRVKAGGGLVQEQHRRPVHEHGRYVQPPPHAAGVGARLPVRRFGQAERFEQLGYPAAQVPAAEAVQPALHGQVLLAGQQADGAAVLADRTDHRPDLARPREHVDPGHRRPALVRPRQRGQDAHGRGLAGAVRPEQRVDRAGRNAEAESVERAYLSTARSRPSGRCRRPCRSCGGPEPRPDRLPRLSWRCSSRCPGSSERRSSTEQRS